MPEINQTTYTPLEHRKKSAFYPCATFIKQPSCLVTMVPAIKGTSNRTISCKLHLYLRLDWPPVKSIILVFNQYIKVADPGWPYPDPTLQKNIWSGSDPQDETGYWSESQENRIRIWPSRENPDGTSNRIRLHSLILFSYILNQKYLRYFTKF